MFQNQRPKHISRISRREFLKLSGLGVATLGLGKVLSGCTPGPSEAPKATVGGTIDYMSFEGYDLPTCMEGWKKENNVALSPTYIGDQNEVQAKLTQAQSTGYDLITYFQGVSPLFLNDLDILQPIDGNQVPNRKDIYELFRTSELWNKDGKIWGVPFTWGLEGCNYNADKTGPPQSWMDLLKPEFKGLVGMVDEVFSEVILGGRAVGLGDSLPNITEEQLAEIKAFLIQLKQQARGIAPSYGALVDMFAAGEIIATFPGWAAINIWSQDRGVNVQHTLPVEGGYTFVDAYAIPKQSDNVVTATAWINEALTPEVQACQAASLAAGVVNPEAVPLLDEKTASLYDYEHMEDMFKNAPLYTWPPRESDEFTTFDQWIAMWEEVKAT